MSEPEAPKRKKKRRRPPRWLMHIVWRVEAVAYDAMIALLRALPVDTASNFGAWMGKTFGPLGAHHHVARTNLKIAFPDMPEDERQRLLMAVWDNVGRTFAEFAFVDRLGPGSGRTEVVGLERLHAIRDAGKPVVFVSGHLANWELMMATLVWAGVPSHTAYRPTNNPYVDKRIREGRARYGVELLSPKGKGGRDLMLSMRRGVSVAMLIDQKFNQGIQVPFFGKPAPTMPGAARMAVQYGATIQPLSVERLGGARFRMIVEDPIELPEGLDREALIEAGTRLINERLEARIRRKPDDWFWVHRRWPREVYRKAASAG